MSPQEYEEQIKRKFGAYLFNKYDIADLLTGKYKEYENGTVECPYL